MQDPKDEFWSNKDFHNKCLSPLRTLNIFNITQPQGVLLASYLKFNVDGFMKVLSYIEALSIRYNVICQNNPTEQEGFYNKLARKIFYDELTTHIDVKNELLQLFPKDQEFLYAFSRRQFKTSQTDKKVRHLLTLLERFLQPDNQLEDSALTLEHILPKRPDIGWEEFNDDELEEYSARLGNMTLLNKGKNNSLGNTSYVQKKIAYIQSTLTITKTISDHEIWNAKAIDDRQNWLANKAKELWKL